MQSDEHFKLIVTEGQAVRVIELTLPSVIDGEDFDRLNDDVLGLLDRSAGGRWVVDLSKVSYLGSSMLGLMVNIRQRVRQSQGVLVLCGMSERLTAIFEACSLERLFRISRTRADAVRAAMRG